MKSGPGVCCERLRVRKSDRTMASEHIGELKKWATDVARKGGDSEPIQLVRALELVSKNFGLQPHEVAILGLTSDGRSLRFLAPDSLRTVGQIPLSSTNSLAARTVREKRPELINHFSVVPHASVFEAVPIADEQRGDPIQKIMSAPILSAGKVVGVLQVSRKGKAMADAGPDFSHPQLRELKLIADALGPCIVICNKD
jgi:GAF domain-containing protein